MNTIAQVAFDAFKASKAAASGARPGATQSLGVLARLGRKLDDRDPKITQQAATKLVSQLFFTPLLEELRKSPFGEKFAHGGRGEDVFGQQLDTLLADTSAAGDPGGITSNVMRKISALGGRDDHSESDASGSGGSPNQSTPPPPAVGWPILMKAKALLSAVAP